VKKTFWTKETITNVQLKIRSECGIIVLQGEPLLFQRKSMIRCSAVETIKCEMLLIIKIDNLGDFYYNNVKRGDFLHFQPLLNSTLGSNMVEIFKSVPIFLCLYEIQTNLVINPFA